MRSAALKVGARGWQGLRVVCLSLVCCRQVQCGPDMKVEGLQSPQYQPVELDRQKDKSI